jgi:ArsR family transcriptional regulator
MSPNDMAENARRASAFLKTLANEHRLLILCQLAEGEKSVSELEALVGLRQPTMSQQLARLRADGVVKTRREAKMIYYSLASSETRQVIELLFGLFCAGTTAAAAAAEPPLPLASD